MGFERGSAIRQLVDTGLRQAGISMNVVMELRSIPAIIRMVRSTGNLAFVSAMGVNAEPDIALLQVEKLDIRRTLAVISRRGAALSPAASAFAPRCTRFAGRSERRLRGPKPLRTARLLTADQPHHAARRRSGVQQVDLFR